jgi:hypothetical protein
VLGTCKKCKEAQMAKLAQLAGLTTIDANRLSDVQANYLAMVVGDTLMREALQNPATISPTMARAVRSRTERMARTFREQNDATERTLTSGGGHIGPPPLPVE